jgi:hypothetical protein
MRKPVSEKDPVAQGTIEHDPIGVPRNYTAWHHFLARALEKTQTPGFDVHCFVKLGTLPLEADIIILRLDDNADTQAFARYFGFLVPALRRFLILEYKSPEDRLTLADFDTVRAYAMLCKRKYEVACDEEIAVAMLYSRSEADFFAGCARNGHPFVETLAGVRQSTEQPMGFYAVDLVAIGEQQPEHPINLLSARRQAYRPSGQDGGLGPFAVLYEEVFLKELKKMGQMQAQGYRELTEDAKRTRQLILSQSSVEERLQGIPAAERLRDLAPEDRLRGLHAEDLLSGLDPAELARLRELLLKQDKR